MASVSLVTGQAGFSPNKRERKATAPSSAAAADDEGEAVTAEEIEELERELADLDGRVLEKRRGHARRVVDTAASQLAALRSTACLDDLPVSEALVADKEKLEKLKVIRSKNEANAAALQKVLERVNECIAQSDKLEDLNVNIHPVFKENGKALVDRRVVG